MLQASPHSTAVCVAARGAWASSGGVPPSPQPVQAERGSPAAGWWRVARRKKRGLAVEAARGSEARGSSFHRGLRASGSFTRTGAEPQ